MTSLQQRLTELIGSKELKFGCRVELTGKYSCFNETGMMVLGWYHDPELNADFCEMGSIGRKIIAFDDVENCEHISVIGSPATLSDLHRWLNSNSYIWEQRDCDIKVFDPVNVLIEYDSSLDLLDQSERTLLSIINLIEGNEI